MTRDEIMALANETAPRYMAWGIESHFQRFASRVMEIEREACAKEVEDWLHGKWHLQGVVAAARIRARGGE